MEKSHLLQPVENTEKAGMIKYMQQFFLKQLTANLAKKYLINKDNGNKSTIC